LSRLKLGTEIEGGSDATALGVVCSSGSAMVRDGGVTFGKGGGGIDVASFLGPFDEVGV
jgi:hypothetical protein